MLRRQECKSGRIECSPRLIGYPSLKSRQRCPSRPSTAQRTCGPIRTGTIAFRQIRAGRNEREGDASRTASSRSGETDSRSRRRASRRAFRTPRTPLADSKSKHTPRRISRRVSRQRQDRVPQVIPFIRSHFVSAGHCETRHALAVLENCLIFFERVVAQLLLRRCAGCMVQKPTSQVRYRTSTLAGRYGSSPMCQPNQPPPRTDYAMTRSRSCAARNAAPRTFADHVRAARSTQWHAR